MQAVSSYELPPDQLAKAIAYAHARYAVHFAAFAVSTLALLATVCVRMAPRLRRLHPAVYFAAILFAVGLYDLPGDVAAHAVSRHFGISIQTWPAWLWDWSKAQAITIAVGIFLLWPFYALLRSSPRRWWLWAWLAALPLIVLATYVEPLVIEPLFNKYQPLDARHPALTDQIEQLLRRAGVQIPRDHIVEMDASEKTNALNAYVSGIGASRRVVLYDTIIRKEDGAPLLTTIGHELGHTVLHHIGKGLIFGALMLAAGLYLMHLLMDWIVARWGAALDIQGVSDRASLPVLLLLAAVIGFLGDPIGNAFSRWEEHQADQYSLEVTHGILPNPGEAAAVAFQIEGETDLDEPHPNPFIVFWLYSHPPTAERLKFSLEYDPWSKGQSPEWVR